jgi:hypothetical protein
MREYKISDIENLEQFVYDTIEPQIKEFKESFEKMGFNLKCELVNISSDNDSLIRFTVRGGEETFSFSVCYIARGNDGGYFVSPLIKEGDITNDVVLLLERVKAVLLEKGFNEARNVFGGMQKDAYKENSVIYKTVKVLKFLGVAVAVLALGAIIAFLITMI